jgi:hypothetical protein
MVDVHSNVTEKKKTCSHCWKKTASSFQKLIERIPQITSFMWKMSEKYVLNHWILLYSQHVWTKLKKKKGRFSSIFFHSQNKLNANQMNHQAIAWLVKSPHVRPFFNQNLFIATSPSFMLKIMLNSLFVHDFMSKSHFSWLYQLYHHVSMAKPLFLSILYGYIIISLYNINI